MVNGQMNMKSVFDFLSESQVNQIIKEYVKDESWQLIGEEMKPAADGIAGFLGDHFKVCLHVKENDSLRKIRLFVKSMPLVNHSKAKFIDEGNFHKRELTMLKLFDELQCANNINPWCSKAFLYTDKLIVMPDLCFEGYKLYSHQSTLDLDHVKLALASLGTYHATFANYETKKTISKRTNYTILEDYGDIIKELNFKDCAWLRTAAKLSADMIRTFSNKFRQEVSDLEKKFVDSYIEACDQLRAYDETLNVVIHKDLWINNIMFKYEDGVPKNAVILDFQCVRYAPPAFDIMIMLYLTTSRKFRELHEKEVLAHYFEKFSISLDVSTKSRLRGLNYDFTEFLKWVEVGRRFGLLEAVTISPYVLMEPKSAQEVFDDADTFEKYTNEDRSEPVFAYCQKNSFYKQRQLELTEEYVERYIIS